MKLKRKSFAKIEPIIDIPPLLEVQKKSFERFIEKDTSGRSPSRGLSSIFSEVFPIENSDGTIRLEYVSYELKPPKISPEEAKEKDLTYSSSLYGKFRVSVTLSDGTIKEKAEQEVYLGELPLMTDNASFIINGDERVVVSQIHRSPGVVFEEDEEQKISIYGKPLCVARIIPYRGAWVEIEFDQNNVLYVKLERRKRVLATMFLRALGYEKNEDILKFFSDLCEELKIGVTDDDVFIGKFLAKNVVDTSTGEVLVDVSEIIQDSTQVDRLAIKKEMLEAWKSRGIKSVFVYRNPALILTLKKDPSKDQKSALSYIYKMMKSQDFIVPAHYEKYLDDLIFGDKPRRYDLTRVGRYKINRKLAGVFEEIKKNVKDFKIPSEDRRTLTREDVVAAMRYLLNLSDQVSGNTDDIDHLGNRRVRPVGELLENQVRVGLLQMARYIRDHLNTKDKSQITPRSIINTTPFANNIRKFFATGQLSQFLEQTNPLAEMTNKRRLSALGPGGLNRKRAGFEVRDVHHTHYGRICPIETPEGENIGLIVSLSAYSRVNDYGLLETPYRKVENGKVTNTIKYLTADAEDEYYVAQATEPIDPKTGKLLRQQIITRRFDEYPEVPPHKVDYVDVTPLQVVSVSAGLIPFLEHDDANRALMGSNMQRQAVPLLITEPPLVATGIDEKVARDSGVMVIARKPGEVVWVDASKIIVYNDDKEFDEYILKKYKRTNQDTCMNQRPLVSVGDRVREGTVLADGMATSNGQLALGKNLLVAFMPWDGYNFEDAIIVSDRLVREDILTSIHIQEFTCEARETKGAPEEITRDIPNAASEDLQQLDENGIIFVGAEVEKEDILVGKTAPKGEQQVGPEERLIKALFGQKSENTQDASLRVPPGVSGKVIGTRLYVRREKMTDKERESQLEFLKNQYDSNRTFIKEVTKGMRQKAKKSDVSKIEKLEKYLLERLESEYKKEKENIKKGADLGVSVNKVVKVYIAVKRRLQVGDKLAGRHGNKGVISKIVPMEDMPRMPDGTPVDVILSPLSIPSRMNVGQLLESMLGWAAKMSDTQMITPVFCGATEEDVRKEIINVRQMLIKKGVPEKYLPDENLRITLYDGRTGEPFLEKVTIGYMYILKLIHLVEDKMHARSTGPYSLVTRQPLGGKAHQGGQRLGEMEVWALEAYGAAHMLQEFLTIKSDDEEGREKMFKAIMEGRPPIKPGVPASFKVLVSEMRALGLNVELLSTKKRSVSVSSDDDSKNKDIPEAEKSSAKEKNKVKTEAGK